MSEQPAPLDVLLRWERAGGAWQVLGVPGESVTVALCRCDGGEEVDRLESTDPELLAYVAAVSPSSQARPPHGAG